ncbi:MAG: hypothetical protein RL642_538 [Bacteroidota bacterium]|jgi:hypothetical protein
MKYLVLLVLSCLPQLLFSQAERYDVVIQEIMADPTPVIGLPNAEYIELRNRSSKTINLLRWRIDNGSSAAIITSSYLLEPDSIVLLCSRTQLAAFSHVKNVIGLTSFPAINNEGDLLRLKNADGKTIHAVAFDPSWYNSPVKANGGWSLEMIDIQQPCAKHNWSASSNTKGGTPGQMNSINGKLTNTSKTALLQCTALDERTLILEFDSPLDSLSLTNIQHYQLIENETSIQSAVAIPPLFNQTQLNLTNSLDSNKIYTLVLKNMLQCDQKTTAEFSIRTGLSKIADKGDLVFNEVMFDPEPGGEDFIELINTSNRIINAKQIQLSTRNADGTIHSNTHQYLTNFNLFPLEPVVLTTDTSHLMKKWNTAEKDRLLLVKSLPSMPDDDGNIVLMNYLGKVIDEMKYDKYMHHPLLRNKEGVSLEKINIRAPSQQKDNWHSAASSVNYASPTKMNSQFREQQATNNWIQFSPDLMHPNNSGQNDYLQITYQFDEPGTQLTVHLFNQDGVKVCTIINNLICGLNGSFNWNGLDNQQRYISTGIYIAVADAFHLNGTRKRFKKVIAIKRA